MHDGSLVTLHKVEHDYEPTDKLKALGLLNEAAETHHFYTGLMYYGGDASPSFTDTMNLVDAPLATLPTERIRPSRKAFDAIMESFK